MAGHARYTALLDACVLYPLAMTDALLSLATAGFFAAKWTKKIENEWIRSLERQRPDLAGKLNVRFTDDSRKTSSSGRAHLTGGFKTEVQPAMLGGVRRAAFDQAF